MNRVTHFEIPSDNPEKSMDFYTEIFNWKFDQFGDAPYWLATTGEEGTPGINGAITRKHHPDQPITNSIQVKDIDTYIQKVEAAGGNIVVPKTTIPNAGWYCFFKDPDGNIMGMMEANSGAE